MEPIGATQLVRYEPDQVSAIGKHLPLVLISLNGYPNNRNFHKQEDQKLINPVIGGVQIPRSGHASRLHGLHVLCMGDQQGIVIEGAVLKLRNLPHCELCPANEWSWLIQLQPVMYRTECKDNQSSAKWFLRKYWKQNPESYHSIKPKLLVLETASTRRRPCTSSQSFWVMSPG